MLLCTALLEIMRINYFNFRKFAIISIQYLVYMTNIILTVLVEFLPTIWALGAQFLKNSTNI